MRSTCPHWIGGDREPRADLVPASMMARVCAAASAIPGAQVAREVGRRGRARPSASKAGRIRRWASVRSLGEPSSRHRRSRKRPQTVRRGRESSMVPNRPTGPIEAPGVVRGPKAARAARTSGPVPSVPAAHEIDHHDAAEPLQAQKSRGHAQGLWRECWPAASRAWRRGPFRSEPRSTSIAVSARVGSIARSSAAGRRMQDLQRFVLRLIGDLARPRPSITLRVGNQGSCKPILGDVWGWRYSEPDRAGSRSEGPGDRELVAAARLDARSRPPAPPRAPVAGDPAGTEGSPQPVGAEIEEGGRQSRLDAAPPCPRHVAARRGSGADRHAHGDDAAISRFRAARRGSRSPRVSPKPRSI